MASAVPLSSAGRGFTPPACLRFCLPAGELLVVFFSLSTVITAHLPILYVPLPRSNIQHEVSYVKHQPGQRLFALVFGETWGVRHVSTTSASFIFFLSKSRQNHEGMEGQPAIPSAKKRSPHHHEPHPTPLAFTSTQAAPNVSRELARRGEPPHVSQNESRQSRTQCNRGQVVRGRGQPRPPLRKACERYRLPEQRYFSGDARAGRRTRPSR